MTTLALIVSLCTVQLACCLGLVWYLMRGQRADKAVQQTLAIELVERLQAITNGVAADVGRHDAAVKKGNDELEAFGRRPTAPLQGEILNVVEKIIAANHRVRRRLVEAEQALAEQAELIDQHAAEARTDALTGLANRRAFDAELARCLEAWKGENDEFSLVLFDIDHFKSVNDRYGHAVGDEALKAVAQASRATLRNGLGAFRHGGEEFAIVLPGASLVDAQAVALRLWESIPTATVQTGETSLSLTASFGIAQALLGESADTIVARADKALYAAKHGGRDAGFADDGAECKRFTPPRGKASPGSPPASVATPASSAKRNSNEPTNGGIRPTSKSTSPAPPRPAAPLGEICQAYERGLATPASDVVT